MNLTGYSNLSLVEGSFIWSLYDSQQQQQFVKHLRLCPSTAVLDQDSYRCVLCPSDSMSVLFQQSECISCNKLTRQYEQAWNLCLTHETSNEKIEALQEIVKEAEEDDEEIKEQVFIDEIPIREKPKQVTPVI